MRSISSIPFTISLTCKYILIVRYPRSLFFRSDMDSPKNPRTSRPTILEGGVKETTGSRYPSKIKHGLIMPIYYPTWWTKWAYENFFYGIMPTCIPLYPFFPHNVLQPGRDGALENSIIVYENTHGITNRMTRGGTGRCLQTPYSTSSWVLHTTQNHPHPFNRWFIYQLHQSFKIFKCEKPQRTLSK